MTYTLDLKAFTDSISDRALEQLCRENPDLRFETDANGKLIIMSPTTQPKWKIHKNALVRKPRYLSYHPSADDV